MASHSALGMSWLTGVFFFAQGPQLRLDSLTMGLGSWTLSYVVLAQLETEMSHVGSKPQTPILCAPRVKQFLVGNTPCLLSPIVAGKAALSMTPWEEVN